MVKNLYYEKHFDTIARLKKNAKLIEICEVESDKFKVRGTNFYFVSDDKIGDGEQVDYAVSIYCGLLDDDEEAEKKVVMANDNFTEVASIILEGVGGKDNVMSVDNCITRLRLEVKDNTLVNEKKIKSAGISGVIRPGKTSVQVVVGTKVQFVADEFKKLCK